MKIFGWMQNKLSGIAAKNGPGGAAASRNYGSKKEAVKEEFSDWPQGLLTIGTFGNNEPEPILEEDPSSSPDLSDFTPEEVGKLQEELKKLLSRKSAPKASKEITELPLDKFLNCPSSLEIERRIRSSFGCDSGADPDEDINKTISVILGKCKEVSAANKKKDIRKKSVSFLLKKMFACGSGFAPAPSLRDPLPESRMEKLLRAMIYKTRFPQPSARPSSATRYLENRQVQRNRSESDEERREKESSRSKWVKTDSEYIVLEI
uniref:Uncharacterized protein n=1 Tax=Kalanchoe fedtschenkoi TaxID=63787 RepID=A0A7N0RH66_KALFE